MRPLSLAVDLKDNVGLREASVLQPSAISAYIYTFTGVT